MSRRMQWCPRCKTQCHQQDGGRVDFDNFLTAIAQLANMPTGGVERYAFLNSVFEKVLPDMPHMGGYMRYRNCLSCGKTWTSFEVPDEFLLLIYEALMNLRQQKDSLGDEVKRLRQKEGVLRENVTSMIRLLDEDNDPAAQSILSFGDRRTTDSHGQT